MKMKDIDVLLNDGLTLDAAAQSLRLGTAVYDSMDSFLGDADIEGLMEYHGIETVDELTEKILKNQLSGIGAVLKDGATYVIVYAN